MKQQTLLLGQGYIRPQKTMDLPTLDFLPPVVSGAKDRLRINTYSRPDLYERYLSDEEEPSPSPEDSASEDEVEDEPYSADQVDDEYEYGAVFDCRAEIAVAVPIMVVGRPRLVDITNIAPMQKRKRPSHFKSSYSTLLSSGSRLSPIADKINSSDEHDRADSLSSTNREENESFISTAPSSWLPEQDLQMQAGEDELDSRFDFVSPSTYFERDPYNLEPPRLRSSPPRKRAMRSYNHPPSSMKHSSAWRGLRRSLSIAKRPDSQDTQPQRARKAKCSARRAPHVEPMMVIPPFSFETTASGG